MRYKNDYKDIAKVLFDAHYPDEEDYGEFDDFEGDAEFCSMCGREIPKDEDCYDIDDDTVICEECIEEYVNSLKR